MNAMQRKTIFSEDRKYRYTLWREWWKQNPPRPMCRDCADHDGVCPSDGSRCNPSDYVMFIGLNPSTADETQDDPTIRRCIGFAKAWGYGALCMTNLFAFRATDPKVMKAQPMPLVCEFVENSNRIIDVAKDAGLIVCAWGAHGNFQNRANETVSFLRIYKIKLHHLGLNRDGTPKHPLYLRKDLKPIPF